MLFILLIDTYNKEGSIFHAFSAKRKHYRCLKTFAKRPVLSNSPQYVIHRNHTCGVWAQAVHCQNGQIGPFVLGVTLQDLLASLCKSTLDEWMSIYTKPTAHHVNWRISEGVKKTLKWINLETWQMNNDKDYPSGNYLLLLSCLLFSFSKANWPIRTTYTLSMVL